jgi:hypothetical protein
MQTVILINAFEVPADQEEPFLAACRKQAGHMSHTSG